MDKECKEVLVLFMGLCLGISLTLMLGIFLIYYHHHPSLNDIEAEWLTGIGTIFLGLTALFAERISRLWFKPKLEVLFDINNPVFYHKTKHRVNKEIAELTDCYYVSLQIENKGNKSADNVETIIYELEKQEPESKRFEKVDSFLPLNLKWAYTGDSCLKTLNPGISKYVNLGHINDPKFTHATVKSERSLLGIDDTTTLIFNFEVDFKPILGTYLLRPGTYRVKLKVSCSNIEKPTEKVLTIEQKGTWDDDRNAMITDGVVAIFE